MENNNKNAANDGFQYTYSAKDQEELKRIREKYTVREESKMERLRRLDASVTKKAQTVSLILGILGALVLGSGMSLFMTDLSNILGAYEDKAMIIGICVGVVGCVLVCLAYPVYNAILKSERRKITPEIIRLTDELMK